MTEQHTNDTAEHITEATLRIVPPAISREEVDPDGRVGAVAYPYFIAETVVRIPRTFITDRTERYVVSVDRSRRLTVKADVFPETHSETVEDVLVLPAELTSEQATELARHNVFRWTLRRYAIGSAPEIEFDRTVETYKLFWLAEHDGSDEIVDSLRGSTRPLVDGKLDGR